MIKEGILHKAKSNYGKEPWTITTVHTNGTNRIQMELTGFNVEPEWNDLVFREYNHLQMIFYELKANMSGPSVLFLFSYSHKIMRFFDSNTILTSYMTTQIIAVNFFPY